METGNDATAALAAAFFILLTLTVALDDIWARRRRTGAIVTLTLWGAWLVAVAIAL